MTLYSFFSLTYFRRRAPIFNMAYQKKMFIYALCIAFLWTLFIKFINMCFKYMFVHWNWGERPCQDACHWCSGSGMPSGHAQLVVWLSTVLTKHVHHPRLLWVMCLFVCAQRILSSCHSVEQVLVGAIIGGILGQFFKNLMSRNYKTKHIIKIIFL